jgi:AraC family transcriptional regulator
MALPDFVVMHGGPRAMRLTEHEHDEIQIEAHFSSASLAKPASHVLPDTYHLIPSGKPHVGSWNEGSEVVVVLLDRRQLETAAGELMQRTKYRLEEEIWGADPVIQSVAGMLRREFLSGITDPLFLEALRNVLSGHLVRSFAASGPRVTRGRLNARMLRQVLERVEEKLDGDLTIETLAAHCGMGTHRFSQVFKQSVGLSPYSYIMGLRITRAKHLLATTSLSVAEIAYKVGWASQSHFATAFRRHTQYTPQGYRRLAR